MKSNLLHRLAIGVAVLAVLSGGVGCSVSIRSEPNATHSTSTSVRAAARDATALISTYDVGSTVWSSRGSGSVMTPGGIVLTNNHVIAGAGTIKAQVGGTVYDATLIVTFPSRDVALIQLQGAANLPTITVGNSDTVAVGDTITSYGNSEGINAVVVLHGTVTALGQPVTIHEGDLTEFLLNTIKVSDRVIYPGNSGGPLTNADDEVIGMNTAGPSTGVAYGNAIPINQIMLIIGGYVNGT